MASDSWGRSQRLLLAAAEWLDNACDPLSGAFLSEHDVTCDEAYTLSEQLAVGARMFASTMGDLRKGGIGAKVAAHRLVDAVLAPPQSAQSESDQ